MDKLKLENDRKNRVVALLNIAYGLAKKLDGTCDYQEALKHFEVLIQLIGEKSINKEVAK